MADPRFALGIDFGTSHTTAVLRWPDGHVRPLLFEESPLLPSAVYAEPDGRLLVGRDAIDAARRDTAPRDGAPRDPAPRDGTPRDAARFEPTPKRRFGHPGIALGGRGYAVADLVAAVLARVRDEAVGVSGAWPGELSVTLTHPATWSGSRRSVLAEAADLVDLPDPRLVPEPVAAAAYFVEVAGAITPGSALVVYHLGAATFSVAVVAPGDEGYEVLAADGLDDLGGTDLDAALLDHIARTRREVDDDTWGRLLNPVTPADRRHHDRLVDAVRAARETLSHASSAAVPVPLQNIDVTVTRDELEAVARPLLERTIGPTSAVIGSSKVDRDRIAAVLLVGGASRMPLVATLLGDALGVPPTTMDHPELVVAEGSVRLRPDRSTVDERVEPAPAAWPPPADPWATAVTEDELVPHLPAAALDEPPLDPGPGTALAPAEMAPGTALVPPTELTPGTALVPLAPPEMPAPAPAPPMPSRPYGRARPVHVSSPWEDPVALPAAPATDTPPASKRDAERPVPKPRGPYLGTVVNTRSRPGRWLRGALVIVGVLTVGGGAVLAGPRVLAGGPDQASSQKAGSQVGDQTANDQTAGDQTAGDQAATDQAASVQLQPYLRVATPAWLPAGWVKVVDDAPGGGGAIVPGAATPAGTCTYSAPGVIRVTRGPGDVAACRLRDPVGQVRVRDAAAEAQFALTRGCGALWMRTGNAGYVAMACANGAVELHELGRRPPGPASRRAAWRPGFGPANVVVGLLAQGPRLTLYVDGVPAGTVVDGSIASGRLGVGGFAPAGGLDATVTDFRAWRAP